MWILLAVILAILCLAFGGYIVYLRFHIVDLSEQLWDKENELEFVREERRDFHSQLEQSREAYDALRINYEDLRAQKEKAERKNASLGRECDETIEEAKSIITDKDARILSLQEQLQQVSGEISSESYRHQEQFNLLAGKVAKFLQEAHTLLNIDMKEHHNDGCDGDIGECYDDEGDIDDYDDDDYIYYDDEGDIDDYDDDDYIYYDDDEDEI